MILIDRERWALTVGDSIRIVSDVRVKPKLTTKDDEVLEIMPKKFQLSIQVNDFMEIVPEKEECLISLSSSQTHQVKQKNNEKKDEVTPHSMVSVPVSPAQSRGSPRLSG